MPLSQHIPLPMDSPKVRRAIRTHSTGLYEHHRQTSDMVNAGAGHEEISGRTLEAVQ